MKISFQSRLAILTLTLSSSRKNIWMSSAQETAPPTVSEYPSYLDFFSYYPSVSPAESLMTAHPSYFSDYPSASPTKSPSASLSKSPSASPNKSNGICQNCIHTATINPDPHYTTWSNDSYDFQGGCDQIAVDNPVLQIQIRTRPRNGYSAITQVAIIFKQNFELFLIEAGQGVITNTLSAANGVTYSSSTPYAPDEPNYVVHEISFNGLDSFIIINDEEVWDMGLSMQIRGHGSIFSGSEGMLGSWDHGGVRFPNGTMFDTSGGFAGTAARSILLAEAWMVYNQPSPFSLLNNPSTVCDASASCGEPGDTFTCDSTRRKRNRNLRGLQANCATTDCSFIANDIVRAACEQDLVLSGGDTKWTCQRAYTNPVIEEADPCDFLDEDCPSSAPTSEDAAPCVDSNLRLKIKNPNANQPGEKKYISRSCKWVANKDTKNRCALEGVSAACPVTCDSCDTCDDPTSSLRFKFTYNGQLIVRNCNFIGRVPGKVWGRCKQSDNICRATCNVC